MYPIVQLAPVQLLTCTVTTPYKSITAQNKFPFRAPTFYAGTISDYIPHFSFTLF